MLQMVLVLEAFDFSYPRKPQLRKSKFPILYCRDDIILCLKHHLHLFSLNDFPLETTTKQLHRPLDQGNQNQCISPLSFQSVFVTVRSENHGSAPLRKSLNKWKLRLVSTPKTGHPVYSKCSRLFGVWADAARMYSNF